MSETELHTTSPFAQPEKPSDGDNFKPIILELLVSDPDSLRELLQKGENETNTRSQPCVSGCYRFGMLVVKSTPKP